MKSENSRQVQNSFTLQADGFEKGTLNLTKKDYLDYIVSSVAPNQNDHLLEVAAGTCACSRSLSSHIKSGVCLDMTSAILARGRKAAEEEGINNLTYVLGDADELPFLDESFDIVLSRLAFHHFSDPELAFKEMVRVLRPGGKLVMIDMEAPEDMGNEPVREIANGIEALRDPSHTKTLSHDEMKKLYTDNGLTVITSEAKKMPTRLSSWLELTGTPIEVQYRIRDWMQEELDGEGRTGFRPYIQDGEIWFNHSWVLTIGRK